MSARPKPITPAQVKAIHVALHRKGIDDAAYRELLKHWNATSCKDLSRLEASDLLARLGRPLANPRGLHPSPRARRQALPNNVFRLASKLQRDLVAELVSEIHWGQEDGFSRWLRSNMGLTRITTDEEAGKVIEGLKAIKRRQHKDGLRRLR